MLGPYDLIWNFFFLPYGGAQSFIPFLFFYMIKPMRYHGHFYSFYLCPPLWQQIRPAKNYVQILFQHMGIFPFVVRELLCILQRNSCSHVSCMTRYPFFCCPRNQEIYCVCMSSLSVNLELGRIFLPDYSSHCYSWNIP